MERVHINTHIEKTAGTSLLDLFTSYYGRDHVYIYNSENNSLVSANHLVMVARTNQHVDMVRTLLKQIGLTSLFHRAVIEGVLLTSKEDSLCIPNGCYLIHGHFNSDHFDRIVKNPIRSVIFRNPLERTISHYMYWRQSKGVTNHRINIPYNESFSFEDFAFQPVLQNFQSKALGKHKIEDFDIVGVTEKLPDFIAVFNRISAHRKDINNLNLKNLNKSPLVLTNKDLGIDSSFERRFRKENIEDYDNYEKAANFYKV